MTTKLTLILPRDGRTDRVAQIGDALHFCGVRPNSFTWADTEGFSDTHVWMAVACPVAQVDKLVRKLHGISGAQVTINAD